jgi:hypothetical protein
MQLPHLLKNTSYSVSTSKPEKSRKLNTARMIEPLTKDMMAIIVKTTKTMKPLRVIL